MKETVTDYESTEVEKTITEYATTEVQREQYVSDLTGAVIDEDDVITLYANPEITDAQEPSYMPEPTPNLGRELEQINNTISQYSTLASEKEYILDDENSYKNRSAAFDVLHQHIIEQSSHTQSVSDYEVRSGGKLHVSVSEFAELADIDEKDIDTDDELPEAYVDTAEPEVHTLFDNGSLWCILFMYIIQNVLSLTMGEALGILHTIAVAQLFMAIVGSILLMIYIPSSDTTYDHEYSW